MSELLVLNPRGGRRKSRRGKRRRGTARRAVSRRRRRVHNPARNVFARRVHRRRRRSNPRRRRYAARRHNPRLLGIDFGQITMIAAGGVVTEVLADKLAKMLPASWATNVDVVRIGTKAAVGIGLPLVAKRFLPRGWGNAIAIGGGVVTLLDIVKTYVAPHIPGLSLSGYEIGPTANTTATIGPGLSGVDDDGMSGVYGGNVYS